MALSTIAELQANLSGRLQDPNGTFWLQQYEQYQAIAEAISDMLLLIGRPTQMVSIPVVLTPNIVWQAMPPNMLAITTIRSATGTLWKTSLHSMDYLQSSWGSEWEGDVSSVPARFGPLGLTYYFVHPAPSTAITVQVTGIANPIQTPYPPTGAEVSPFHNEFNVALQMYATAYCRIKELGDDALEGDVLFQQYLDIAQRLSVIEDRRDGLIFSKAFGTPAAPSLVSLR
jgi:hypothetical protein